MCMSASGLFILIIEDGHPTVSANVVNRLPGRHDKERGQALGKVLQDDGAGISRRPDRGQACKAGRPAPFQVLEASHPRT